MTNMDNQYMNKSNNEEDVQDHVEEIHPGNELVNYFNNGLNYNNDNDDEEEDDYNDRASSNYDNAHVNANKRTKQYVASFLSGSNHCGQVLQY